MAQPIVIEFTSDATLYNAITLANKLTGDYDIKIQYNGGDLSGLVPAASLDTDRNLVISAAEIDAFINDPGKLSNGAIGINSLYLDGRLFQDENSALTDVFNTSTVANSAVGLAPAIKKSMTIDFLSPTGKLHEVSLGSQIEVIADGTLKTNPEPFTQRGRELVVIFRINFASGFKIDDGNPGNKINVEINNLTPTFTGANFYDLERTFPAQALNYAEHGALVENHENLKLNNLTLDTFWAIGRNQREVRAAPILNKPDGDLTITGEVVSGQAFQYTNSFAYNQGRLHFDNANVNFYDISKVSGTQFTNTFGGMARAKGAIVNALGAHLSATNSRFSQESADRSGEYTDASQLSLNRGDRAQISTDVPFEAPSSLQYLIDNYGKLNFEDSELSGVINTEGDASFVRSRLGLSKSNGLLGNNVNIRGGVFSLDQSIVDNIKINALSAFGFNKKNSVVLKGRGSGDLSNALLSLLNPNQPSFFSDATRQGYTPVGLVSTRINPLAYRTYDPSKLNPSLLSAVNSILSGTTPGGGGTTPGGGGTSPGVTRSIIKATRKVDRLVGTSADDTFLFPDIYTGTNPGSPKRDRIIGFQAGDRIKIGGFNEKVIGLGRNSSRIFNSYGTVRNLRPRTISNLLGKDFQPKDAAIFQVQGGRGSFLAVNRRGIGFNRHDMLVQLTDFLPTTDTPLILV